MSCVRLTSLYLPNGHCPQTGAGLPVYLAANGALIGASAMLVAYLETGGQHGMWTIQAEGFPAVSGMQAIRDTR